MRNRLFLSVIAATGLLVGSAAQAAPLASATWSSTTQGVSLSATNSGATCSDTLTTHVQQMITCPTAGLGATGSATAASYNVSLTMPLFSVNQFTTGGAIPIHTLATLSGAAGITGNNSSAKVAGGAGVPGGVTVKVAAHTKGSLLAPGMTTLVKVPLSVGKAGTFTGYFYVLGSIHYITVDFYAWTPHTLTFTALTSKFMPLTKAGVPMPNTVVAMGSFGLTGAGVGTVTIVAPSKISIDGPLAQRRTASFTKLTLTYAPEPATLLLLGAGVAGLALLGSRKRS